MPIFTGRRRPEFSQRITEASEKPVSLATWLLLSKNGWICSEGPGKSGVILVFLWWSRDHPPVGRGVVITKRPPRALFARDDPGPFIIAGRVPYLSVAKALLLWPKPKLHRLPGLASMADELWGVRCEGVAIATQAPSNYWAHILAG